MNNVKKTRLAVVVLVAVVLIAVASTMGAGGDKQNYRVRAVFDNVIGLTVGGDVRIAGATAGTMESFEVTGNNKASVVFNITDPAFQRFYSDARCWIRLQSLIGEKFIDCNPGTKGLPELRVDPQDNDRRLMLNAATFSPVDLDLNFNVLNLPTRERLRVIINEFGAALAGRGKDISAAIKSSNPALYEVDQFLAILAKNNEEIAQLAKDGDTSLVALARERKRITSLLRNANKVQLAVNERQDDLRKTLNRLPAFFDELEPTANQLEKFAVAAQPISKAANESATDLSTFITDTPQFTVAANKAFKRFGDFTDVFLAQLGVLTPFAIDLRSFASYKSTEKDANQLLNSFEDQGGYANLMTLTIGLVGAMNGYDKNGHRVRSSLIVQSSCTGWQLTRTNSCATGDFAQDRKAPGGGPVNEVPTISTSGKAAALDYLLGSGN